MPIALTAHPDHPTDAVRGISVDLRGDEEGVALAYHLDGDLDRIKLPEMGTLRREDRLWRSTCFEMFLRHGNVGYREYNFAPDGRWSAYRFGSYRHARSNLPNRCSIVTARVEDGYTLSARVMGQGLAGHDIGLSVIVEEQDGTKSFWAVKHPPGKADFHNEACFALSGDDY
ncbi:hypothetical protein [Sphingomicrobium sediminis]|uniref:DOMON-like domain-containing protein n=1 Tax=Sphingomicrobium sediminis TaxID=2950949 RepID=A0A9X2J135_9SPHN|nr:hypothetical protein [Sphingomicrobium sediminis]MCM8556868.1 hypothetical protein [Sphingomicrobium sediminis]